MDGDDVACGADSGRPALHRDSSRCVHHRMAGRTYARPRGRHKASPGKACHRRQRVRRFFRYPLTAEAAVPQSRRSCRSFHHAPRYFKHLWRVAATSFGRLLADVTVAVMALAVFCTLWRALPLRSAIKKKIKKIKAAGKDRNDVEFRGKLLLRLAKTIGIHFSLTIVDFLVMPIAIGLLLTWRSPVVISAWAGGGFYEMFAVTAVSELGR